MKRLGCVVLAIFMISCSAPKPLSKPGAYCPLSMVKPGLTALDFRLLDTAQNPHSLSDFHGNWVVLSFGSRTSPSYVASISDINRLAARFMGRKVVFLTVYSAEANPELLADYNINDFQQRFDQASKVGYGIVVNEGSGQREITGAKRPLVNSFTLVDTTPMGVGAQYGYNPPETENPAYIIDPDGKIALVMRRFDGRKMENALVGLTAPGRSTTVYKAPVKLE